MAESGERPTEQDLAADIAVSGEARVAAQSSRQADLLEVAATLLLHVASNAPPAVRGLARIELEAKGLLDAQEPLDPVIDQAQAAVTAAAKQERRIAANAERFRGWIPVD